jgi:hypothetical protein
LIFGVGQDARAIDRARCLDWLLRAATYSPRETFLTACIAGSAVLLEVACP